MNMFNKFFEGDITECCAETCPRSEDCLRHISYAKHKPGDVYTVSDFSTVCSESNKYEYCIPNYDMME